MFRIMLSLSFIVLFAFAENCDFNDKNQEECELDINKLPNILHKLVDDNSNMSVEFGECIYDGNVEIDEIEYNIINCSMFEKDGALTEGIIFNGTGNNLIKNKYINLKQDNVLLKVAGDVVLDSGIRFNTSKPKNLIVEIIEGSNGKSNLVLQRGAALNATAIIMPDGEKSNIRLHTFYGGIYEKDFIDMINKNDISLRGDMETLLNVENILSLSDNGENATAYNGYITCGPEVNPLDLANENYILKRLYKVKNTSKDAPSDSNSICNVKEGNCFVNILDFANKKIDEKSYKIATSTPNIIPTYGIFIESGKITSNSNIDEILGNANITNQNQGKCNAPIQVAFSQDVIDEYNAKSAPEVDTEVAQEEQNEETINSESLADNEALKEDSQESQEETADDEVITEENTETLDEAQVAQDSVDSTDSIQESIELDETTIENENIKPALTNLNDSFLIVEKNAYDKFNKDCYGEIECVYNSLAEYDTIIWDKVASKNNINSIYVLNLTNNNLEVICNVADYYGENLEKKYNLNANKIIGKIDLRFPNSGANPKIICKANGETKQTNPIVITPAKFNIKPKFDSFENTPMIKAGDVKIEFIEALALTMEGDIDNGFSGNLIAQKENLSFSHKNKCDDNDKNVFIDKPLVLEFKNGRLRTKAISFVADAISSGKLDIKFDVEKSKICDSGNLQPQCTSTRISKNINIIPDNFMIKTDIISDNKISYYGQIDDRGSFKYNPILDIELAALNNRGEVIDINKNCNYGSMVLSLKNDKLIEFKRSVSDRLNSKINIYLEEFENNSANIKVYFGINKIADNYKNIRVMKQNDLLEPQEIVLTDFSFNLKFKNGGKYYDYNNLVVYDAIDNANPFGILFVRGKINTNDVKGTTKNPASLIAKYDIYCENCDTKLLAKYLGVEDPEIDTTNWYINTKHPSNFFISDDFINIKDKNINNNLVIENSNKALEGRQEIIFTSSIANIYPINLRQRTNEFAPYLNYNSNYKNVNLVNEFSVMINEEENTQNIDELVEKTEEIKEEVNEVEPEPEIKEKIKKPKEIKKETKQKNNNSIKLDIED